MRAQTWKEWGRSLDLKDASPSAAVGSWLLLAVQGLPPTSQTPASFFLSLLPPTPLFLVVGIEFIASTALLVVCDRTFLTTAPRRQVVSGFPSS